MELKPERHRNPARNVPLLIVPYGIETNHNNIYFKFNALLIVPYGIETYYRLLHSH